MTFLFRKCVSSHFMVFPLFKEESTLWPFETDPSRYCCSLAQNVKIEVEIDIGA